jgi:hypothetical protein
MDPRPLPAQFCLHQPHIQPIQRLARFYGNRGSHTRTLSAHGARGSSARYGT